MGGKSSKQTEESNNMIHGILYGTMQIFDTEIRLYQTPEYYRNISIEILNKIDKKDISENRRKIMYYFEYISNNEIDKHHAHAKLLVLGMLLGEFTKAEINSI